MNETDKITFLEQFNIYFSYPIDLDFLMLTHFFNEYTLEYNEGEGPRIPKETDSNYKQKIKEAVCSVCKKSVDEIGDLPNIERPELYFWYRYLFLGKGKPISHLIGVSNLKKENVLASKIFENLFKKIERILQND